MQPVERGPGVVGDSSGRALARLGPNVLNRRRADSRAASLEERLHPPHHVIGPREIGYRMTLTTFSVPGVVIRPVSARGPRLFPKGSSEPARTMPWEGS